MFIYSTYTFGHLIVALFHNVNHRSSHWEGLWKSIGLALCLREGKAYIHFTHEATLASRCCNDLCRITQLEIGIKPIQAPLVL